MFRYKINLIILFIMFSIFNKSNAESKSFFDFSINLIDGQKIELSKFKGKSILLVNVAIRVFASEIELSIALKD